MTRSRKQVARFDPSPDLVASWNDTSGKMRPRVEQLARVRHRLMTPETAAAIASREEALRLEKAERARERAAEAAAAAATAAATAAAAAAPPGPVPLPVPGKKRPRVLTAAGTPVGSAHDDDEGWPRVSRLRTEGGLLGGGGGGGEPGAVQEMATAAGSSLSESSIGYNTSGSDTDSSFSLSSAASNRLMWRPPSPPPPMRPGMPAAVQGGGVGGRRGGGGDSMASGAAAGGSAAPPRVVSARPSAPPPTARVGGGGGIMSSNTGGVRNNNRSSSTSSTSTSARKMSKGKARLEGGASTAGGGGGGDSSQKPFSHGRFVDEAQGVDVEPRRPSMSFLDDTGESSDSNGEPFAPLLPASSDDGGGGSSSSSTSPPTSTADWGGGGGGGGGNLERFTGTETGREASFVSNKPHQPRLKKRRNVVTIRVARSQMPERWSMPPPPFSTCLKQIFPEDRLGGAMCDGDDVAAVLAASIVGLGEGDGVDAENWLASGCIDIMMAKFARTYPEVHFMPIDFAVLCLNRWGSERPRSSPLLTPAAAAAATAVVTATSGRNGAAAAAVANDSDMVYKDILGRPLDYSKKLPVIFLTHVNNVHWNLLRVQHYPVPELQLFEPMGKPARRQGVSRTTLLGSAASSAPRGTGFRCIPKGVYRWLDTVWPLSGYKMGDDLDGSSSSQGGAASTSAGKGGRGGGVAGSKRKAPSPSEGWASRAYSAITQQQQTTGFDCGVAALLYAEKCGQGQMREDIDKWTTQADMTVYREGLQGYVGEVLRPPSESNSSSSAAGDAAACAAGDSSCSGGSGNFKPAAAAAAASGESSCSGSFGRVPAAAAFAATAPSPPMRSTVYPPPVATPSPSFRPSTVVPPPPVVSPLPPPVRSPRPQAVRAPPLFARAPASPPAGWEHDIIDLT